MVTKRKKQDSWLFARFNNWRDWCRNPRSRYWHKFGGAGITIHAPWLKDYWRFHDWVETTLGTPPPGCNVLDRIDNSKGYQPGNLRWASQRDNHQNRCNTIWIKVGRRKQSINDWCRELNLCKATVWSRGHDLGWTWEEALELKPRK
jgi:hypothetical protein